MAAVISGNGLGLFDSSLTQLGLAHGGSTRLGQSRENHYVNVATGNLVMQGLDELISVRGFEASFVRTYNSRGTVSATGQDGWVTGYERRVALTGVLNAAGSAVALEAGDGHQVVFTYSGTPNVYTTTAGDGAHDRLQWNDTARTWTYTEGSSRREEVYADHADAVLNGRLTRIRDLRTDGSAPAQFDILYDAQQRVSEVRSVDGAGAAADAILFAYSGTTSTLASVSTREGGVIRSQVSYGYDSVGRLSWVQTDLTPTVSSDNAWQVKASQNDGKLFRTFYSYVTSDPADLRIASVATSDGTSVAYTYEADQAGGYRVRTLTRGSAVDGSTQTVTFTYGAQSTDVVDSRGATWTYEYDSDKRLIAMLEAARAGQRQKTSYTYDTAGNLTRTSQAPYSGENAALDTIYQYDSNGNRTLQRDRAGNTVEWVYDLATNRLLREIRYTIADADGLDPSSAGGSLPGGALTTHYVHDAQGKLRFVVNPAGDVREYTYAGAGDGVGQLASERLYARAYTGSSYSEANLASWASGLSEKRDSQLTEYLYDAKGRLKTTVEHTEVDGDWRDGGEGDGILNSTTRITSFSYSAQGLLLQKVVLHGSGRDVQGGSPATSEVVDYVYDGMGRLLSVLERDAATSSASPNPVSDPAAAAAWDAATILTTYAYVDSENKVRISLDSGVVRTEARNRAGHLISSSEVGTVGGASVARTTLQFYDGNGRLRAIQDATGGREYYFYDLSGRLTSVVDKTGSVVTTKYDGVGRAVQTVSYSNRADSSAWLSGQTVVKDELVFSLFPPSLASNQAWVKTDSKDDRNAYRTYDTAGRLSTEKDAAGVVKTYEWDGASRLLSTATAPVGMIAPPTISTNYFYDASDRLVATLDPEGALVENVFDCFGRITKTIRYATRIADRPPASAVLASFRPAASVNDQITRNFYDGRGELLGVVSAEGYLTEYVYDEAGNQRAVKTYAKHLTNLSGGFDLATARFWSMEGAPAEAFQLTQRSFNALGQLQTEVNHEGTVTRYTYDDSGRLIRTEAAFGVASEVRQNNLRFDVFGNLIGELSGEGSTHLLPGMSEAQLDAIYSQYGTRHSYDLAGRRIESIDAGGNKTWYFYDAAGRSTFLVRGAAQSNAGATGPLNGFGEVAETRYNAFGQVAETINYTGRITIPVPGSRDSVASVIQTLSYLATTDSKRSYTYTTRGLLASVRDAEQVLTQYTYNAFGWLTHETRAVGTTAETTSASFYDMRGLLTSREEAAGTTDARTLQWVYDVFGRVESSTDGRGSSTSYTYDKAGRQITRSQSVLGRQETWTTAYDAFDRTLSVTNPHGHTTHYVHSDAGRSMTMTTAEGVVVVTTHNRLGQVLTVTEALGQATTYHYNRDGQETGRQNALNPASESLYYANGLLASSTDAAGRKIELRYDAVGRVLQRIEDPQGLALTTSFRYDAQGRLLREVDPSGRVSEYRYDREGRLTETASDPAGLNLRTTYRYDAQGRRVEVVEGIKGSDTSATRTTHYGYDKLGRRTSESVDPSGLNLTTTYAYDDNGNVIRRTDANGQTTRYYYSESNQLIYTFDALGAPTRHWYDTSGRLVATRSFGQFFASSSLTDITSIAALDAQLDWNANLPYEGSYRIHDRDGRVRFELNTQGQLQEHAYDVAGRPVHTRRYAALAHSAFAGLDLFSGAVLDSQVAATALKNDVLDQVTYRVYDAAGRVRYTVDALGNVSAFTYDAAGHIAAEKRFAQPATMSPALRGKLTQGTATPDEIAAATTVTGGRDMATFTIRDAAGRIRYTINSAGSVREILLDGGGRTVGTRTYAIPIALNESLWSAGGHLALADVEGKLTATIRDDVRNGEQYQVFDAAGRVRFTVEVNRDRNGVLSASVREARYDAAGRVTEQIAYQGAISSSTVAANLAALRAGSVSESSVAGWVAAGVDRYTYSVYDAAGRLRYKLAQDSATTMTVRELRYDAAGRVSAEVAYANRIATSTAKSLSAVAAAITAGGGDTAENHRQTRYVHDANGQIRFTIDDLGAVTEQRYDGIGRITETRRYGTPLPSSTAASESAVASAVAGMTGVRTTITRYDAAGQVASITDADQKTEFFGHDGIGRRISHTDKLGQVWTYAFDAAGRLATETSPLVVVAIVSETGAVTTSSRSVVKQWTYDALGNVLSRTEDATGSRPRTTTYLYDNRGNQIRTTFPDAGVLDVATGTIVATGSQPTIGITYNTFDQAVVQKDVRGHYSYKVYDALGRIAYEVDPAKHVTAYAYNAWGERTNVIRYATSLSTSGGAFTSVSWQEGQAITMAQVAAGLATDSNDRTMFIGYTQLGQRRAVTQMGATYYTSSDALASGNPRTEFAYNAYGDLVKESVLLEGTLGQPSAVWADTHRYYDEAGRNTLTVDAEGYVTRNVYNALGELVEVTEYARAIDVAQRGSALPPQLPPSGDAVHGYDRVTRWTYDALGRKSSETAVRHFQRSDGSSGVRDVVTEYSYDAEDRLTEVTKDTGPTGVPGITVTTYDALDRVVSVQEASRSVVQANAQGVLTGSTANDIASAALYTTTSPYTTLAYDAFGNVVRTWQYANGKVGVAAPVEDADRDRISVIRHDWQGRAVWERNAEQHVVTRTFDAADHVLSVRAALAGNDGRSARVETTMVYDAVGRQQSSQTLRTELLNGTPQRVVNDGTESVRYNAFGEIVAKGHDLSVRPFAYTYDAAGRLTSSNDTGLVVNYGYNLAGHQLRQWHDTYTSNGTTIALTLNSVDKLGRVLSKRLPSHTASTTDTSTITQRFDRWGNVLQVIDTRGYQTDFRYNAFNQVIYEARPLVQTLSATGQATWQRPINRWFYDALGQQIGTQDANGNLRRNDYDAVGRLVQSKDALGAVTRHAYDTFGDRRFTQNPLGYLTFSEYDRLGRVVASGDYLANTAGTQRARADLQRYVLNENGDRLEVKDALGHRTRYDYDSRNLLQRSQSEMGVVVTYAYNARGEKISEWRMAGDIFTDRDGDVVQAGALTWNYDAFGRVIDHNNLSGRDYDYAYNAGRQISESSAGGVNVSSALDAGRTIEYYANGRIHKITEDSGNFVSTYTYRYDAAGNRTYEEVDTFDASGINGAPNAQVRTITQSVYDSNNRLQRVVQDDVVSGKRVFDLSYDYDTAGNRRRVVAHSGYGPDVTAVPTVNAAPVAVNATLTEKVIRSGQPSEFRWLLTDVFRDAENDTLIVPQPTLSDGSALPSWLSYRRDVATGELVFTTTAGSSAALNQDFTIRLTASDDMHPGTPATATFVLRVRHNTAPAPVAGAATFTAKTARPWNLSLSAAEHFTDPDVGDRLTLAIVSQPGWMQVSGAGSDALHLSATVGSPTTATVVIRATDERGAIADKTITIDFADNAAPTAVLVSGADATLGRPFNWTIPLPQVFTDVNGDPLTVTARLSNGNALPSWMQFVYIDQAVPVLQLSGQLPSDAVAGTTYSVRFTAVDGDGESAINDVVVTVRPNRAPVAHAWNGSIQVGQPYDQTIGFASLFTDLEGDALSLQTLWPSGSPLPAWLNVDVNYANRTVRLHGTPDALPRGPYAFQVQATDVEGLSSTTTLSLTVVNTPPTAAEIPNATGNVGAAFGYPVPPFYDVNGDVLSYSATGLPPGLTINPNNHTITGTPTTVGSYAVTVTAHDGYGGSASTAFQITIGAPAANRAPRVEVEPDVHAQFFTREGEPAEATHFTLPENTLVDDDGNPLTYTVDAPSWLNYERIPGGGHHFWGVYPGPLRHAYPIVTLTASDGQATGSASFQITCEFLRRGEVLDGEPVPVEQSAAMAGEFQAMSTPVQTTTHWYTYDAEHRTKIDKGVFNGAQILMGSYGSGSTELMYDAAGRVTAEVGVYGIQRYAYDLRGNRTLEFHNDMAGQGAGSGGISRQYIYDAANRLDLVLSYYGAIDEIQAPLDGEGFPRGEAMNLGGWLQAAEDYTYDADNRLITQWSKKRDHQSIHWQWEVTAEEFHLQHTAWTNDGILATSAEVKYTEFNGAGLNTKYTYHAPSIGWAWHTFTTQYEGWAGFQEKQVAGVSTHSNYKPTTNTLSYDGYGRLREQRERTEYQNGAIADRSRVYSSTYEGQVLTRRDGTRSSTHVFQQATPPNGIPKPNYLFVHAGGQQQAELAEGGTIRTSNGFSYSPAQLQGLNGTGNYAAGGGKVTVLEGETLQGLAQRVYGSAQLWYVLADANGLSDPSQPLTAGTQLNAPSVNVSSNDAGTFKPYNPNEAIGSTSPSLPYIVPPPKPQCNALAMIIIVVVAVIVTVYTAGAAAGAMGSAATATGTAGTAAAGTATAASATAAAGGGFAATMSTGAAVLAGGYGTAAAVVGGAVGAFAGSIASQAVGSVMGVTSFSWRNAVQAGVSAGLTAGLANTSFMQGINTALQGSQTAQAAAQAVAGQLTSYAASKIAGVDASFSWRQIAMTAVAQGLTAAAGPKISGAIGFNPTTESGQFGLDLVGNFVGGTIGMHASRKFGFGGDINYGRVAADAFGNTLANAISGKHAQRAAQTRIDQAQRAQAWNGVGLRAEVALSDASYRPEWLYGDDIGMMAIDPIRRSAELTSLLQSLQASTGLLPTFGDALYDDNGKYKGYPVPTTDQVDPNRNPRTARALTDQLRVDTLNYHVGMAALGRPVPREFPGMEASGHDLVLHNNDLQQWLYLRSKPPVTAMQAVAATVLGSASGAVDLANESVAGAVVMARNLTSSALVGTGLASRWGVEAAALRYHAQTGQMTAAVIDWARAPLSNTAGSFRDRYDAAAAAYRQDSLAGYYNGARLGASATIDAALLVTGVGGAVRSGSSVASRGLARLTQTSGEAFPSTAIVANSGTVLPASELRFSQKSVSYFKVRPGQAPYTYDDILSSMRQDGWRLDQPNLDVVRMPDGMLTSVDNTRVLAAREAGIDVRASVHSMDELLTREMTERFAVPSKNFFPQTWGDVIMNRIGGQGSTFSRANPFGTYQPPRVSGSP